MHYHQHWGNLRRKNKTILGENAACARPLYDSWRPGRRIEGIYGKRGPAVKSSTDGSCRSGSEQQTIRAVTYQSVCKIKSVEDQIVYSHIYGTFRVLFNDADAN